MTPEALFVAVFRGWFARQLKTVVRANVDLMAFAPKKFEGLPLQAAPQRFIKSISKTFEFYIPHNIGIL